ncbi:MAG: methyltransferase domain-containing protein [Bacteroidota bacterium]
MLTIVEQCTPETLTSAYSFGLFAGYNYKSALYSQILSGAGLRSGDIVLGLSCSDEISSRIMAAVNVVETGPMGGMPGMMELVSLETGFGKNSPEGTALPWSAGSFNTIMCIGIFNHIADQNRTISCIRELLAPSGKLLIADQWFRNPGPMFTTLLQSYTCNSDFRIYSPVAVTRLLKRSGFGMIETRPAGATNFLCTATVC